MDEPSKTLPLMERLNRVTELYSLNGPKRQGLPRAELLARVKAFMLSERRMRPIFAFGEGDDKSSTPEGFQHFDPIAELEAGWLTPETIIAYVEAEMQNRRDEVLSEAKVELSSYNIVLFAAAIKLSNGEGLSKDLCEFVVEHLVNPPKWPTSKKGRPKRSPLVDDEKKRAIQFTVLHGLKRSRNSASDANSACDIVSDAAIELYREGYEEFATGWGYDTLVRIKI